MTASTPASWLDLAFKVGIILKGLDGAVEIAGGLLLLFVTPEQIHWLVRVLTQGHLSQDPDDVVARYLLHTADGISGPGVLFGAVYLLVHGIVKVVLVTALLLNRMWAYPWLIGVLILFILYQLYRIALTPATGMIALTIFDALVLALTWREWRVQRRLRGPSRD